MTGGTGNALREAYSSPANAPAELLRLVFPGCAPRPAGDGSGVLCDPRGGEHAEHSPSFTFWRGQYDGGAVFQRKGSGETWNALTLLEQYGSGGAGMSRKEAAALLISRAGLESRDTLPAQGAVFRRPAPLGLGKQLREKQGRDYAPEPLEALKGWEPLAADMPEGQEPGAAWQAVNGWGLLPAVDAGLFPAYRAGKRARVPAGVDRDAVAFVAVGPDGSPLAVKFRNPGSSEQLKAAGRLRYKYPKGHKGTPAHCSPELTSASVSAEVWTEGEKNSAAFMLALHGRNLLGTVGVQGMAGAGGNPHVKHDLTGRKVFVYADGNKAGESARLRWARLASELGAVPFMLPAFPDGMDAADFLGAHGPDALAEWLASHMHTVQAWTDPEPPAESASDFGEGFEVWPYKVEGGQIGKLTPDKDEPGAFKFRPLLGFTARIVAEVSRDSGDGNPLRVFQVEGRTPEGRQLPALEVPVSKFGAMGWPLEGWGADGFVYPGSSTKDEARAALLSLSRVAGMERRTVHTRTGWADIPGVGMVFLTAGVCIGAAGAVPGVGVSLLGKLKHYALPEPLEGNAEAEAVRRALELLELAPPSLMFPLLGGIFRAPLGAVRFSIWLESRTGWGKSTLVRALQAFYGAGWIEHFPPADFQSTDNALTLGAYLAADVPYVADDFKPEGTRSAVDAEHAKLSRFLSSAGNGSGRDRMTSDALTVRAGYYPRGLVIATAETSPRKHSDVARTVHLTVPGPLFGAGGPPGASELFEEVRKLAEAGTYASCTAGYLRFIAQHFPKVTGAALASRVSETARQFPGTHGRTAQNSAELLEGWRVFLSYAVSIGAVSHAEGMRLGEQAAQALRDVSVSQAAALENVDPVSRFLPLLSGLLRSGAVYLRDAETGEAPGAELDADAPDAPACGWRWRPYGDPAEGKGIWETRPGAVPVGWLGEYGGQVYALLESGVYVQVNKAAEGEGYGLPAPRSLWRGLKDRHAPSGEMVTQGDRATYPRSVYGLGPKERTDFYNLIWPLPLQKRDERDTIEKTPSETGSSGVPFYFLETGQDIYKRDTFQENASSTVLNGVPFLPSAENAEQDAANVPEFEEITV